MIHIMNYPRWLPITYNILLSLFPVISGIEIAKAKGAKYRLGPELEIT